MERKIIHVDMDAFFAAVEIKDNMVLKGRPIIVGGDNERGVVCTCSYEARKFGVRSAMPGFMAKAKCPNGIFLPVRMERYKEVSKKIFKIFYSITPYVEPLSIDEAYLDITHLNEDPLIIANYIKDKVKDQLGLTLSVGVSYNKFLAKLASDWNKPNGIKVISRDMIPEILFPLPINKIYGLGKKSVKRLNNIGIFTVEELYELPKEFYLDYLGNFGIDIYNRIRGLDDRVINITRERKSIGKEITLKNDTKEKEELGKYIEDFSKRIANILNKENIKGKTITIKLKTKSFESHTKSKTLLKFIDSEEEILKEALALLNEIEIKEELRLIGLTISSLEETKKQKLQQLSMFL